MTQVNDEADTEDSVWKEKKVRCDTVLRGHFLLCDNVYAVKSQGSYSGGRGKRKTK